MTEPTGVGSSQTFKHHDCRKESTRSAGFFVKMMQRDPYYKNPRILDWISAAFERWVSLQRRDGSFDEAYPFERSFAATSFSLFYLSEGLKLVEDQLSPDVVNKSRLAFQLACSWLQKNSETHGILSNHIAAGAAGMLSANRFLNDPNLEKRAIALVEKIFQHQSTEGWYEEYGGPDMGYQTHCLFYLARIWQIRPTDELLNSLKRAFEFQSYFVHLNKTIGGEYMYRNTTFYFPAAFEMMSAECPIAAAIAAFLRASVKHQKAVGLQMADVQNYQPLLNNYLFASNNATTLGNEDLLPHNRHATQLFKKAGIFVKNTPKYQAVLGMSKGGVIKIYDKVSNELVYSDCGYFRVQRRGVISSQSTSEDITWKRTNDVFEVDVPFVRVNQTTLFPWRFLAFRLFSLTLGRHPLVARYLKSLLVSILVTRKKKDVAKLKRSVVFKKDAVLIEDSDMYGIK